MYRKKIYVIWTKMYNWQWNSIAPIYTKELEKKVIKSNEGGKNENTDLNIRKYKWSEKIEKQINNKWNLKTISFLHFPFSAGFFFLSAFLRYLYMSNQDIFWTEIPEPVTPIKLLLTSRSSGFWPSSAMSHIDLEALLVLANKSKTANQNARSPCFCCRGGQQWYELCSETGQDLC